MGSSARRARSERTARPARTGHLMNIRLGGAAMPKAQRNENICSICVATHVSLSVPSHFALFLAISLETHGILGLRDRAPSDFRERMHATFETIKRMRCLTRLFVRTHRLLPYATSTAAGG